jgi:hypothetical protein
MIIRNIAIQMEWMIFMIYISDSPRYDNQTFTFLIIEMMIILKIRFGIL